MDLYEVAYWFQREGEPGSPYDKGGKMLERALIADKAVPAACKWLAEILEADGFQPGDKYDKVHRSLTASVGGDSTGGEA